MSRPFRWTDLFKLRRDLATHLRDQVLRRMHASKVSTATLAARMHCTQQVVESILDQTAPAPNLERLLDLCFALGLNPTVVLESPLPAD